ncbi:MAG: hypothetical protein AAF623_02375 [Planctomycetota bacterium]
MNREVHKQAKLVVETHQNAKQLVFPDIFGMFSRFQKNRPRQSVAQMQRWFLAKGPTQKM